MPIRNSQERAVSCGGLMIRLTATTGAYSTAAAADMSQTKRAAPATDACLLSRFQLACATAATPISARAVAFRLAASCPASSPAVHPACWRRLPLPLPVG